MDMAVYYIGQVSETPASRIATNLRALRAARGMSTITLAKLSGVARATLTKIEAGDGNPTIDTLYAVADALGVPLGDLIGEPAAAARVVVVPAGVGATVRGAVSPRLLDRVPGHVVAEVYEISFSTQKRTAGPHPAGVLESLFLTAGRVRVGPAADPVELGPGDYLRFPGDVPHVYQAIGGPAHGVLLMSQP
jgi:transcriptional regulator with XRE-family HTH domain